MNDGLSRQLLAAEARLWVDFEQSKGLRQTADRGGVRESALVTFLQAQLPDRFRVASGEVIDSLGNQSGQQDLLIWDAMNNRPLLEKDGLVLIAAESLLASVEVKSKLNMAEVKKTCKSVDALRGLQPWAAPFWLPRTQGEDASDGQPRFMASLFAFDTDLAAEGWAEKELARTRRAAHGVGSSVQYLDRLVVLNRGLLLPSDGVVAESSDQAGALATWFFSLVNFVTREVTRRPEFPWNHYEVSRPDSWRKAGEALRDAPTQVIRTRKERNDLRRQARRQT